jgi:hypothetical protein
MKLNWLGSGFIFGERRKFASFSAFDVELNFTISHSSIDDSVIIQEMKLSKTINHDLEVNQEVVKVYKIITDEKFNKKLNRHYELLKFATEDFVITMGLYKDDLRSNSKPYLVCSNDYINLLAETEVVEDAEVLRATIFEPMMCLFSKKELAKALLNY